MVPTYAEMELFYPAEIYSKPIWVNFSFTPAGGQSLVSFTYTDPDGGSFVVGRLQKSGNSGHGYAHNISFPMYPGSRLLKKATVFALHTVTVFTQ